MQEILIYIPNLLNYVRLGLIIIAMFMISDYPIRTFLTVWLAGTVDMLDGLSARNFSQTSKLGAFLDFGMDRLTNTIQYFYLATYYRKHWYVFLMVQFSELLGDVLLAFLRNYKNFVALIEIAKHGNKTITGELLTTEIYSRFKFDSQNLNTKKLSTIKGLIDDENSPVTDYLYSYVWYSSDIFYWILYFGIFYNNSINSQRNELLIVENDRTGSVRSGFRSILLGQLEFSRVIVERLNFLSYYLSNQSIYINNEKVLKFIFQCLFQICAFGAFLKFFVNFRAVIYILNEILIVENDYLKIK